MSAAGRAAAFTASASWKTTARSTSGEGNHATVPLTPPNHSCVCVLSGPLLPLSITRLTFVPHNRLRPMMINVRMKHSVFILKWLRERSTLMALHAKYNYFTTLFKNSRRNTWEKVLELDRFWTLLDSPIPFVDVWILLHLAQAIKLVG